MAESYIGGSTIVVKTGGNAEYYSIAVCIYRRNGICQCEHSGSYKSECGGRSLSCRRYLSQTIGLCRGILPNGYREIKYSGGKLISTTKDNCLHADDWDYHYEYVPFKKNEETQKREPVDIERATHFKIYRVRDDGNMNEYICDERAETVPWKDETGNVIYYSCIRNMDGTRITYRISKKKISDSNSEMVVYLNGLISKDLSWKTPTALVCSGATIMEVNSWSDLYKKFIKMMQQKNPEAIKNFLSDEMKDKNVETVVETVDGDSNIGVRVNFGISYSPEKMLDKMSVVLKRCGLDPCKYYVRVVICEVEDVTPNGTSNYANVVTSTSANTQSASITKKQEPKPDKSATLPEETEKHNNLDSTMNGIDNTKPIEISCNGQPPKGYINWSEYVGKKVLYDGVYGVVKDFYENVRSIKVRFDNQKTCGFCVDDYIFEIDNNGVVYVKEKVFRQWGLNRW